MAPGGHFHPGSISGAGPPMVGPVGANTAAMIPLAADPRLNNSRVINRFTGNNNCIHSRDTDILSLSRPSTD